MNKTGKEPEREDREASESANFILKSAGGEGEGGGTGGDGAGDATAAKPSSCLPQSIQIREWPRWGVSSTLGAKEVLLHLIPAPRPMGHTWITMDGFKGLSRLGLALRLHSYEPWR